MNRLRRERLNRGLTLREQAADIGNVSHQLLHNLETGKVTEPLPGKRVRIERYFGLSLERLLKSWNDEDPAEEAGSSRSRHTDTNLHGAAVGDAS